MTLAFLNIGVPELLIVLVFGFFLLIAIGNYGRNTALGYWGSVLLAIFTTPLIAFLVILVLRRKKK